MKTRLESLNYPELRKFLREEIDRPCPPGYHHFPEDRIYLVSFIDIQEECKEAVRQFCAVSTRTERENAQAIAAFLETRVGGLEWGTELGGPLGLCMTIGLMIRAYLDLQPDRLALKREKNKGGRPKKSDLKRPNQLVDEILQELKCTPADPRFWPTFQQRAEERIIAIPNYQGLNKYLWTRLNGEELERVRNTVLRQHREHREAQYSAVR